MGWLNFGGKKRDRAQGFGDSSKTKSRKRPKSFILEKIVTPSAGFGDLQHEFDHLHQLLGAFSLPDLDLPNFFADGGVCPIAPDAPTNNLPPLIDFDPLGLYHDGIATQTPYNPGGAFETLPIALIPVDPHSPNPNNPNAIRQLLNFPLVSQPLVGSIDTGVSADSPYLNYANIKKGRDYVGGDDNPLLKAGEGSEHGTFMLGIIDAINKTAPKWVGRAIDSGRWADSLVEFVDAAKASGQKNAIANLSLDLTQKNADGSVTTRYELTTAERSAIEYARQNGVMLVVAAGNDGGVMSVLGQASQEFDNIFTVGAGDINGRSDYSSYGRGLDIVADGGTTEHPNLSTVGNDLGTMAGTSVATAKVAGAASLVWAANPALNYRQVMEILKSTARDLGPVGWDDETGFGFLNTLAAVDLAKKTTPEVYKPTAWVTPDTWSGQGKVTPEERAAKGGNSLAAATVQASSSFSDSDRVDSNQPEKYYQFTVTEPGYVSWNLTSLNPVSGFPTPPQVTVTKADGKPGSYTFFKGASLQTSVVGEGQTSFQGGNFYDPGTYYLKVGNGAGSSFKDYNISTQFIADKVSSFTGNIQYRTQPYFSLENSLQSAVFSGPAVSELSNLSGVVTYDNIQFNNRIAKYGVEVNESGKIRINLNSPNGKMEVSVKKFIGSDDRPESIASLEVSANSDGWLELDLNKGRYDIEVKTPSNFWLEPDWTWTQEKLVRPYTLNATFAPNAPQPGQGQVPSSAGAFDKTVVSNGVVNHYYKNGYLTVQPSGQVSWYSYGTGNAIGVIEISAIPLPFEIPPDYAGNSPDMARDIGTLIGTQTFHDVIDRNDRFDYYKFNITSESKVDFALSGKMGNTGFYLFQDWYFNSDDSTHIDRISGTPPGVVPEFSQTLKPGTYYVLVHKPQDYDGDEYDLKLSAVPLDYAGNTLDNARIIPVDLTTKFFKDFVGQTDGDDYYRFDLQEERQVIMTLDGFSAGATVDLLKKVPSNGQLSQLARFDNGTDVKFLDGVLDAGTYYVRVAPNSTGANTNYNFNFSALRLASGWIDSHIIPINPEPSIPQWQKDIDNTYQSAINLLGNPTGSYGKTVSSLNGAQGYGRNYDYGTVYWSDRSGAIALWHDFANTYNENGSFSDWLGFPTKANENWKDGQRIDFEGGYIYWTAQDGAKAYRPWETPNTSTVNDGQTINRKPVITSFPDFQMPYNGSFILQNYANQLQIADPDGDAIQFYEISVDPTRIDMEAWTLEGQPPGKFLIPADQFNTIKFYGSVLGSNPVLVRAFDGKEWSDPKSFNINVVPISNTGGVAITPGNGGSVSPISPSPTPAPISGKGVAIRTGSDGNSGNNPANGSGNSSDNGNQGGGYNPIPGIIAPPIVSIGSVSKNQPEYTRNVKPGDIVKVTGNTNTDNMEFYVGSKKVSVAPQSIDLDTGDFSAFFTVPNDLPPGDYTITIAAKNQLGLSQEFNSSSWITIVATSSLPNQNPPLNNSIDITQLNIEEKIKRLIVYALAQSNDSFAKSEKWWDIQLKLITFGMGLAGQLVLQAFPVTREASTVASVVFTVYEAVSKALSSINKYIETVDMAKKLIEMIFILETAQTEDEIKEQGKILADLVFNYGFDSILDTIDSLNNSLVTSKFITTVQTLVEQLNELFSQPIKVAY
ncbi:S8 family serine peptidase [Microcoleus sp. CAWBG640]|uniref:S8 family serine peptidase n=1 Tax=Microcoleus sp. CAWBG640 TaxID=2841653 RepID=UPI00312BC6AE